MRLSWAFSVLLWYLYDLSLLFWSYCTLPTILASWQTLSSRSFLFRFLASWHTSTMFLFQTLGECGSTQGKPSWLRMRYFILLIFCWSFTSSSLRTSLGSMHSMRSPIAKDLPFKRWSIPCCFRWRFPATPKCPLLLRSLLRSAFVFVSCFLSS